MVIMVCMDLPIQIQPVKMPDSTSTLIRKNRILSARICGHWHWQRCQRAKKRCSSVWQISMYRRSRRWQSVRWRQTGKKILFCMSQTQIRWKTGGFGLKNQISLRHTLHPRIWCAMMQKEMRKTMTERVVYMGSPREDGHRLEAVCENCIRRPLPSCARKDYP